MFSYPRQIIYNSGECCSVTNCNNLPDYEVLIVTPWIENMEDGGGPYDQDKTCPFICHLHMEENEKAFKTYGKYLFTTKFADHGFYYSPIKKRYPELFSLSDLEVNKNLVIDIKEINSELISYLTKHPEFLRELDPRKFEELIAHIFANKGYEITLTPKTRDGGKDIIALYKSPFGHQLFIIECKKYNENKKVGVELVRSLYGVKTAEHFNQAILITTSSFSKPAMDFARPLKFEMELNDFNDIIHWCKDYRQLQ